jgi:transcriptional regulator GlxA family with amidase domain
MIGLCRRVPRARSGRTAGEPAGDHTIETIAYETGFADRERVRRALRTLGQPPQRVRRNAA